MLQIGRRTTCAVDGKLLVPSCGARGGAQAARKKTEVTLAGAQQTTQRLYQKYQTQRKKNETARTEAQALEENQVPPPASRTLTLTTAPPAPRTVAIRRVQSKHGRAGSLFCSLSAVFALVAGQLSRPKLRIRISERVVPPSGLYTI